MILTDRQIIEAHRAGDILIDPFDEAQIQAASYDFRVGEQGATTSTKKIVNIRNQGYIVIEPGDFGIVCCLEVVKLNPQHTGRLGLRSKYARKGLIATTGPQIDPGFHGRLIIGLTNLTPKPVSLPFKDDLLTVEFHRLEEASTRPYDGPFQGKLTLGAEEIEAITETEGLSLSEMLTTLRSLSANVGTLTGEVHMLKWVIPIGFVILAIVVALK
jgi:dCTP deaminase